MQTTSHASPSASSPIPPAIIDGNQRLLARYDFEDGGHVEVRLVGDVETETALDMVETLIGIRRKELAARKRRASSSEENAPSDDKVAGTEDENVA